MKKVLLTATVQSHIAQFHLPLIDMLKSNGYEVHVAARNNLAEKNGLKLESPNKIFDIPFERSPFSKKNIKAYKELKSILFENKYDIIHCNTPMGGLITRLAAKEFRKKGTKVFYTAHGFHFYKGAPLKNWLIYFPIEKYMASYTDKLITITKEDYEIASKYFKTNVCHIHGVGANSKRYFPYTNEEIEKLKQELGYKKDKFLLLCTGELNKNKNQTKVIKAVYEVLEEIDNIILLLAGNGPKDQELKELVNRLGLGNNVDFLGYKTDLEKYVNICDISISASLREGLPLNILEAMLCGKPVIASINRGHKELIIDGENGFVIDNKDSVGLKEKIILLLNNKELRKTMGSNAQKNIQEFTDLNVQKELIKIYDI